MQIVIEAAIPFLVFLLLALIWSLYHAYLASPCAVTAAAGSTAEALARRASSLPPAASTGSGGVHSEGGDGLPFEAHAGASTLELMREASSWTQPITPRLGLGTKMLISLLAVTFYYYESEVGYSCYISRTIMRWAAHILRVMNHIQGRKSELAICNMCGVWECSYAGGPRGVRLRSRPPWFACWGISPVWGVGPPLVGPCSDGR